LLDLTTLGWNDRLAEQFTPYAAEGLTPGRVAVQHRGAWDVLTAAGQLRCDASGRLFNKASVRADLPVVGDWVAVATRTGETAATIHAVLPRRTRFSRKTAWQATEEQVLAANVDVVFLMSSINEDLSLRRLERYLILAWESGAQPVVVLTKADLVDDAASAIAAVQSIAAAAPVHAISSRTGYGLDAVRAYLGAGTTAALLGSSGVGKSTFVNTLADEDVLETREVRADGKGRHTTVRRELVQLPGGALVIDTPGMRELQLWEADDGIAEAFDDVTSLFAQCRFSDCAHASEPGCAVQTALADGSLAPDRWESYLKLQRELDHLDRRIDKRAVAEERKRWQTLEREARDNMRAKGRPT
jgi:ribosome biogenesis GTPase